MPRFSAPLLALYGGLALLRGSLAQEMVTTKDIFLPFAVGAPSLMSSFRGSIVTTIDSSTVYAMSCADGPCNPVAGGTGTLTFTEGPTTFIYTQSFVDGASVDLNCEMAGCPTVMAIACKQTRIIDEQTSVMTLFVTDTAFLPLTLVHEIPKPGPISCTTTSSPPRQTGTDGDSSSSGGSEGGSNGGGSNTGGTGAPKETATPGLGSGPLSPRLAVIVGILGIVAAI